MKTSSILAATCLILGGLVSAANASLLIDNDAYTTDKVSGLDWLDASNDEILDQSFNDVLAKIEPGQVLEGWRIATQQEVADFWTNAGLLGFGHNPGGFAAPSPVPQLQMDTLIDLWGVTGPGSQLRVNTATTIQIGAVDANLVASLFPFGLLTVGADATTGEFALDPAFPNVTVSHALVRNTIPEPTSVFFLSVGATTILAFRRRR